MMSSLDFYRRTAWMGPAIDGRDICYITRVINDTATTLPLVLHLFGYELLNQQTTKLGSPCHSSHGSHINGHARVIKAVEDWARATVMLFFISPLMVVIAIGVKLSSFSSQKVGN